MQSRSISVSSMFYVDMSLAGWDTEFSEISHVIDVSVTCILVISSSKQLNLVIISDFHSAFVLLIQVAWESTGHFLKLISINV